MIDKQSYILVTGAAGFIGSCMVQFLNENGYEQIILADDFNIEKKKANWENKKYAHIVERESLFNWLQEKNFSIGYIFHLGARTDTTEFDYAVHQHLNVEFSEKLWNYATIKQIPFVYASSAATYGTGELGYKDDHSLTELLQPLNPYGVSKNEFDKWVLHQKDHPPFWAGLKFFNVYGPNEYHKGRMASVIWHSFNQIKKTGIVKLFKSHRADCNDGEQMRDFIYVKDVIKVMYWIMEESTKNNSSSTLLSAIYNLGTGKARTFYDLAAATFRGLDLTSNIEFINMPEDIQDKYQYFTEANMQKLKNAGYTKPFYSLEDGVNDYVRNYLAQEKYY